MNFFTLFDLVSLLFSFSFLFLGFYILSIEFLPESFISSTLSTIYSTVAPIVSALISAYFSPEASPTISQDVKETEIKVQKEKETPEEVEQLSKKLDKIDNGLILRSQLKNLVKLMKNPYFGLQIRPRLIQLKKRKAVDGSDIVDWFMSWIGFERREEGVLLGEHLLHRGLIFHVTLSETFVDSKDFLYCFKEFRKEPGFSLDNLFKYFPEERIGDVIDILRGQTETRQAKRFIRIHDNCFNGSDGVEALMKLIAEVETRGEAVQLGQYLLERGVFHHLNKGVPFRDSIHDYYQFYKSPEYVTRKKVLEQTNNQIPIIEQQVWSDDRDWKLLLAGATKRKYNSGEIIFSEGEQLSCFYRISTGTVRLIQPVSCSVTLGPKQVFGQMAAIGITEKSCSSAIAEQEVEVWVLDKNSVNKIFNLDQSLAERFFKNLALNLAQVLVHNAPNILKSMKNQEQVKEIKGGIQIASQNLAPPSIPNSTSSTSLNSLTSSTSSSNQSSGSIRGSTDSSIESLSSGGSKEKFEEVISGSSACVFSSAFEILSSNRPSFSLKDSLRDSLKESSSSLNLSQEQSNFLHQTFGLDKSESLLYVFPCRMKTRNKVMICGNIYISQGHVCFYASLFGVKTKKVISSKTVKTVDVTQSNEVRIETTFSGDSARKFIFVFNRDIFDEAKKILSTFLTINQGSNSSSSLKATSASALGGSSITLSASIGDFSDIETSSENLAQTQLETLRSSDWQKIISQSKIVTYKKNEVIVHQDQLSITIYQIVNGSCRIEKRSEEGEISLAQIKAGDLIGEVNFLRGSGSSVSIVADSDLVELYAIDGPKLHTLFDSDQELAVRFYKYVCTVIMSRIQSKFTSS